MLETITDGDRAQARRLNAWLDRMPRFRMKTAVGRVMLNGVLRAVQLVPIVTRRKLAVPLEVRDVVFMGQDIALRVFRPTRRCRGVILDFHGGGWTIGNARMADRINAELAQRLDVAVVSVDYGLALSRPIDAVIDECAAAIRWAIATLHSKFDTERLIVKGSSAGAHLVAAALLRVRQHDSPISQLAGVMLNFGVYDFSGTPMVREAGPDTLLLHGPTIRATLTRLTPDMTETERRAAWLSPVFADLTGLPPVLLVVGDEDVLRQDSERLYARWQAANGNARLIVAPDSPHGFLMFETAIAAKATAASDEWVRALLA